ncbi:hypothetical protein QJS10_CPB11g00121 [Acorus calamus]|uniref:Uncharacterized protein n=1 Tax=Acorus calamus TaxID=4465 RepID=A0AAV9DT47_ACOCL|nr:hypothetical protein QJS10_CPB11g00121 [Acorus calamus]
MDRLVRSTYLLDYALTGMSVIDPEPVLHSKEEPVLPTNNVQTTDAQLDVIPMEEQERGDSSNKKEKSSKKRKSNKSKGGADKKLKEAMDKDVTLLKCKKRIRESDELQCPLRVAFVALRESYNW